MKPKDLKEEVNEQFRVKHDWLPRSLTLSKIRSLKHSMLDVALSQHLALSTCALSYIFLERLILKNHVTKANRHLVAACCLWLAFKFNEARKDQLHALRQALQSEFGVSAAQLLDSELTVLVDLEFGLQTRVEDVYAHYARIREQLQERQIEVEAWDEGVGAADIDALVVEGEWEDEDIVVQVQ